MKSKDLEHLGVYQMKDDSFRKIISIFWKMNSTGKRVDAPDPVGADIEYVFCDENGQDLPNHKPRICGSTTFSKNAKSKIGIGTKINGKWKNEQEENK